MKLIWTLIMKIWSRISPLLPVLDLNRFRTPAAFITFVMAALIGLVILIIRTFKLSAVIRDMKEHSYKYYPLRKNLKGPKRRSRWGTLLILLLLAAASFALVYFVYPRIPALMKIEEDPYLALVAAVKREKKMRMIMAGFTLIGIPLCFLAFSRRAESRTLRTMVVVFVVIDLIGTVPALLLSTKNTKKTGGSYYDVTADDMLARANADYRAMQYENAEVIYTGLIERHEEMSVTRADLLNNLALAEMQLGKNTEALENMKKVFDEADATPYHVINLLVAAQVNGLSSKDALDGTRAGRLLITSDLADGELKDYVRLRNSIAYNIAYMDMELDEDIIDHGTSLDILFPERDAIGDQIWAGRGTPENAYATLAQALQIMQSDSKEAYGGEDADIADLTAYLAARRDGGVPTLAGE